MPTDARRVRRDGAIHTLRRQVAFSHRELARLFGLSRAHIGRILRRCRAGP